MPLHFYGTIKEKLALYIGTPPQSDSTTRSQLKTSKKMLKRDGARALSNNKTGERRPPGIMRGRTCSFANTDTKALGPYYERISHWKPLSRLLLLYPTYWHIL